MNYCISKDEDLATGFRRIIREQLDKALAGLTNERDPVGGVHTARKTLKRIRTALRVMRPGLSSTFFRKENQYFRDAGRLLSPLRDVHVQREALKDLDIPGSTVAVAFGEKLADEEKIISGDRALCKRAAHLLKTARTELAHWPLQDVDMEKLCLGLRRVYKKARDSYELAADNASPENLHEWRKRIKDFWYALELLGEFRSRKMNRLCCRAEKLSDCLGDDHDFFFIGENLRQQQLARPRVELHNIERAIAKRRARLQRCALRTGRKTFSERPKQFEKRIARRLSK